MRDPFGLVGRNGVAEFAQFAVEGVPELFGFHVASRELRPIGHDAVPVRPEFPAVLEQRPFRGFGLFRLGAHVHQRAQAFLQALLVGRVSGEILVQVPRTVPEGIAVFHPRPHKQPPEHVRKKDFRMMEPILGLIALLPQLNETEELRPDLIHFAGEVHRRLLKDRFRDQRLGGDARVPADGGVGRAVHQRDVAAHVFDVEEHLLLGKDLRQMAVAGGERQIFDPLKVIGEDKRDEGQQRQQGH